jgi:hypothetical protein
LSFKSFRFVAEHQADDWPHRPFGQLHRISDVLSFSGQDFKSTELNALVLRFEDQINRVFARL